MDGKHDVFISYATPDKTTADTIRHFLEAEGVRCWIAPRDIPPGGNWPTHIPPAIETSRIMVLVFSDSANISEFVSKEVSLAADAKLQIIPFRVEEVPYRRELRFHLASIHWLDALTPPLEAHVRDLTRRICEILGVKPKTPLAPIGQEPPQPSKRKREPRAGTGRVFAGMEFCWCPAGSFMMGSTEAESSPDERHMRKVTFSRGFWMGKYPVTQAQCKAVMGSGRPSSCEDDDRLPVMSVSWNDCQHFLGQLNLKEKATFRLPSEAEWEYACRAGTVTPFHFGETISTDQANYDGNHTYELGKKGVCRGKATPVGSFPPNAWGLHDMHGNVWEWCQDWYHSSYEGAPVDGRAWEHPAGECRVHRGGSWLYEPNLCRSAYRDFDIPSSEVADNGFRLVRVP